jgi:uncharacterized protein (TIGR03437 family)
MRASLLALSLLTAHLGWSQTITTIAGNGTSGFSGDGGPAVQAQINHVVGLAIDPQGNMFLAEENNSRIRKVAPDGTISTFAGTGVPGFSGDGSPAASAQINRPTCVSTDQSGNVFICDNGNNRIRRVTPAGVISTIAGNGGNRFAGDGVATQVGLWLPIRAVPDRNGNLYFVDQGAHRVLRIDPSGNLRTLAGNGSRGFSGDGGPASSAILDNPTAIAVDANGIVYFTDQSNQRIRKIDGGIITTFAGSGGLGFAGDGGPATSASFNFPGGIFFDGNILYLSDTLNRRIRRVDAQGVITTIAGTGALGFSGDGGPALQAMINDPFAIAVDPQGNVAFADTSNHRIRKINLSGAAPVLSTAGVTNGASFRTGLVPGAIVTIFGRNFAPADVVATASGAPWPTSLQGVTVDMGGVAAPVYAVVKAGATEQVSVQVPFELAGRNSALVTLRAPGGASNSVDVPVLGAQPGLFLIDGSNGAFLHGATNAVITPSSPASKGEVIVLYCTGLGPVSNQPPTGALSSLAVLSEALVRPRVTIGGFNADVAFAGLAPGFIGLYQINVTIPAAVASGSIDLTVESNGITSNTAKLAVQ